MKTNPHQDIQGNRLVIQYKNQIENYTKFIFENFKPSSTSSYTNRLSTLKPFCTITSINEL